MQTNKIKIVFFGTPFFALGPLDELINNPHFKIEAVITQPDAKIGRKQLLTPPVVKELALKHNLTVLQPEKITDEFIKLISKLEADLLVVVAYGKILPEKLLKAAKIACINIHPSLLPKYRGATPIEEALLNGDTQTGISFIKMSKEMDAGDILVSHRFVIEPTDNALTLRLRLSAIAGKLLPHILQDFIQGVTTPIPQNSAKATYCKKIIKENGLVDVTKDTAQTILNKIRAYSIWPQVWIKVKDKNLKLLEASLSEVKLAKGEFKINKNNIYLGTAENSIQISKLQLEGKKEMTSEEFLRGNSSFLT